MFTKLNGNKVEKPYSPGSAKSNAQVKQIKDYSKVLRASTMSSFLIFLEKYKFITINTDTIIKKLKAIFKTEILGIK